MEFTNAYALVIGVGSYEDKAIKNVPFTVNDAIAIAEILKNSKICGYPEGHVILLENEKATKPAILQALKYLATKIKPRDTFFFFYSGHGAPDTDGEYCLLSYNAKIAKDGKVEKDSGVSERELVDHLMAIRAGRALMIFNACHSGNISPSLPVGTSSFRGVSLSDKTTNNLLSTGLRLGSGTGRIVITACREDQEAYVGPGPLTVFTKALEDGLRGWGVPNNEGYISVFDLFKQVYKTVVDITKTFGPPQEPTLKAYTKGDIPVAMYPGAVVLGVFDDTQPLPPITTASQVTTNEIINIYILLRYFRKYLFVGGLGLLVIILLVIGNTAINIKDHERPTPVPMTGFINVAVANFGEKDVHNKVVDSTSGIRLAQSFSDRLGEELDAISKELSLNIKLRGPAEIGRIAGNTQDERAKNATSLAKTIGADVIIYGYLEIANKQSSLVPEFYLSGQQLSQAEELTGFHPVDAHPQVPYNISKNPIALDDLDKQVREQLIGGPPALSLFIAGLGSLNSYKFDQAQDYFLRALQAPGAVDPEIQKIFYLFLGRTAVEKKDWNVAMDYYSKTLGIQPKYARAQLGLADMLFQKAKDNCDKNDTHFDASGLQNAIDGYHIALTDIDQSDASGIKTKVAFYLGVAHACQNRANKAVDWSEATSETQLVIDASTSDPSLQTLASEAHANLGLIYWSRPDRDIQAALDEYKKAIDLADREDRQAVFYSQQAEIYEALLDYDRADAAWKNAIDAYNLWLERINQGSNPVMNMKYIQTQQYYQATRTPMPN